jgi:hypothetical protein
VHADALEVREALPDGVVALGRGADLREICEMSWWKTALVWIGKKALEIAGEELKKKTRKP